jgi:hypothetical protein
MAEFNLTILFENTFGTKSEAFQPEFSRNAAKQLMGKVASSPFWAKNVLGREYYLPATIRYTDEDSIVQKYDLPHPVIAITNGAKKIVRTELTERRGMVTELVNVGGYTISVKGIIIGKNKQYPEDDLIMLRKLFETRATLTISNVLTDIFLVQPNQGMDNVIMMDPSFPPVPGAKNMCGYEFTLLSDVPFNLEDIS